MSIRVLSEFTGVGAAPHRTEPGRPAGAPGGMRSFQDLLAAASSGEETVGSRRLAAAGAELLRLKMMRSALSLDAAATTPAQDCGGVGTLLSLVAEEAPASGNRIPAVSGAVAGAAAPKGGASLPSIPDNCDRSIAAVIGRASRRYGVEESLIRAVIRAESDFNPTAVSPVGAQGLMQLMPATAAGLGVTDPFDTEQNVMAGTRFLKGMLNRYGGDMDRALAAYNWGPGNLDRGMGRLPAETREYLARVRKYYAEYSVA